MRFRVLAWFAGLAPLSVWLACSSDPGGAAPSVDASTEAAVEAGADASDAAVEAAPKGSRRLGLDINNADDSDYLKALTIAREAGVEITNVTMSWDDVEYPMTDAGADAAIDDAGDGGQAPSYFNPYLHIANLVFPSRNTAVSFGIRPVDTNGSHVPPDLASKPMDDPQVVARFNAMQDYVLGELPDLSITVYVIGNEIDVPFGADSAKYAAYKTFYEAAALHAKGKRPGLKVGVAASLDALVGPNTRAQLQSVNASSDYVVVTYYPITAAYAVRDPATIAADLDALVQLYPGKPIYFREAGFPSSSVLGSSEEKQAEFVRRMFAAWDDRRDAIAAVTFFNMHEYPQAQIDAFAKYYGVSDPRFGEFLRTLGLRRGDAGGSDKPAFGALAEEAKRRGW